MAAISIVLGAIAARTGLSICTAYRVSGLRYKRILYKLCTDSPRRTDSIVCVQTRAASITVTVYRSAGNTRVYVRYGKARNKRIKRFDGETDTRQPGTGDSGRNGARKFRVGCNGNVYSPHSIP